MPRVVTEMFHRSMSFMALLAFRKEDEKKAKLLHERQRRIIWKTD